MEKTTSYIIGGSVFLIDESAYKMLSDYLNRIESHIKQSAGKDEILKDIESRIAEILQGKVNAGKQTITTADAEEVMKVMGMPEDFAVGESSSAGNIPPDSGSYLRYKRFFRDPDHKVIFGVCSGISHHFGIDPIWLRLAFGLSLFIGGFGIFLYLLLAIIIPKAKTAADRMDMQGEKMDTHNMSEKLEDEIAGIKDKLYNLKSDAEKLKNKGTAWYTDTSGKNIFRNPPANSANVIVNVAKGIVKFFAFLIAVVMTCIFLMLFFSTWSGVNIIHIHEPGGRWLRYSIQNIFTLFTITGSLKANILAGLFLFFGVPVIALIVHSVKIRFFATTSFSWFNWIAAFVWIAGILLLFSGVSLLFAHFSVSGTTTKTLDFSSGKRHSIYVKVKENESEIVLSNDSLNLYISDEEIISRNPKLHIIASVDSSYHLNMERAGLGITKREAETSADGIEYQYILQDSVLNLPSRFYLAPSTPWRKQKLDVTLEVPIKDTVYLQPSIEKILGLSIQGGNYEKWLMTKEGLQRKQESPM